MQICPDIASMRALRAGLSGTVGFVPTMGSLHEGHLELMRLARERCDHVIASIYVNPTQFGPDEDFDAYPRALAEDAARCEAVGCAAVFAPSDKQMYLPGHFTTVSVSEMTKNLCGAHREGHFDGVTTIVTKLLNIVQPDVAVFGQKDYQQLAVIRRMVRDLNMPVEIVGAPIVREDDGLAMSSRNRYLGAEDRERAVLLSRGLIQAWRAWQVGERGARALEGIVRAVVERAPVTVDYIDAVDPLTLAPLEGVVSDDTGCVIAMAVHVGQARLLDNLRLDHELPRQLVSIEESTREE